MGSNGLTSARHDIFSKEVARKYPETFDDGIADDLAYTGRYGLTDTIEGCPLTVGQLVLSPTRTYAPIIKQALDQYRPAIHGMVHCSGGAQTKILHFIDHLHVIKDNLFDTPLLFDLIQEGSGTSWKEMYSVFNMGHRMELYVNDAQTAEALIQLSESFGVQARIIGRVEAAEQASVTLIKNGERFDYTK